MTLAYQGSLTLGQCVPTALTAQAQLALACNSAMPDLQARIAGLLQLSIQPPPSIADLLAQLQAMLLAFAALPLPAIPDVSATLAAIAELQVSLGALTASLAFSVELGSLLGAAGIHYYVFAGRADELGGQASAQLSGGLPGGAGGAEHIAGVMLLANDGGAITALQTVMR